MRAIALLAFASFASQAMVRSTDTMLPQIAAYFAVSVGTAAIVVTAYSIAHGSVQFLAGPIADRFGKYRVVTIACALSAITVALCGLATSLDGLVLARLAAGVTAACVIPVAFAFIGDTVPYEQRQHVMGRYILGQVLGQMFGQVAGGIVGDYLGWRSVFFLLAGLLAVAAALLAREMARNPLTRADRTERPRHGMLASYAVVFRSPWARLILLAVFLEGALMQGALPYVSADLRLRFGLSYAAIGIIVGIFALGGIVYAGAVRWLIGRLGRIRIANLGGLIMGVSFLVLALQPVWYFAPLASFGVGLGFFMFHNTIQTEATQMAPSARSTGMTTFASCYFLGQTVGVGLGAPVMDRFGAWPMLLTSTIVLPLAALMITRQMVRRLTAASGN